MRLLSGAALIVGMIAGASGHGAMTFPRPRNALDGDLALWKDWSYPCRDGQKGSSCSIKFCGKPPNATQDPNTCVGTCPVSAHSGEENRLTGSGGQSCYWFSCVPPPGSAVPFAPMPADCGGCEQERLHRGLL